MSVPFYIVIWLASLALLVTGCTAPKQQPPLTPMMTNPDVQAPAMEQKIDRIRGIADRIQIDGNSSDWIGIPTFPDTIGDAQGDVSRDLIEVAIAPRDDALLVLLRTSGVPAAADWAFLLDVDMWGDEQADFKMGFTRSGDMAFLPIPHGDNENPILISGLDLAVEEAIEIALPYSILAKAFRTKKAPAPSDGKPHSWVRVLTSSYNHHTKRIVDYGAAVASFHLVPASKRISSRFARSERPVGVIEFPVSKKWYLGQGEFGSFSHQDVWAYDFAMLDHEMWASPQQNSKNNADYYSWEQPIYAPADGHIAYTYNLAADRLPSFSIDHDGTANQVCMDIDDFKGFCLAHLRQASMQVETGESVRVGRILGTVGNSGQSTGPHLHIEFWTIERQQTAPFAFSSVQVSLNPLVDDPWTQHLTQWMPREGFFIERRHAIPQDAVVQH